MNDTHCKIIFFVDHVILNQKKNLNPITAFLKLTEFVTKFKIYISCNININYSHYLTYYNHFTVDLLLILYNVYVGMYL